MASFFFLLTFCTLHPSGGEPEETDININPAVQIYFQKLPQKKNSFFSFTFDFERKKKNPALPLVC